MPVTLIMPSRRTIVSVLVVVTILLIILSLAGQLFFYLTDHASPWGIVGFLNVDHEMNLPTLHSVLLLLMAALLAGIIALARHYEGANYRFHWGLLSAGFFAVGADEFLALHEKLSEPLRRLLAWETMGFLHFAWVIPGMILALVLAVFYWRFLMDLDRSTRTRLILAGAIFLGGALGVEMIGARYAEANGTWNLPYSLITTVEEGMEMAGTLVAIDALLRYLDINYGEVRIMFSTSSRTVAGSP